MPAEDKHQDRLHRKARFWSREPRHDNLPPENPPYPGVIDCIGDLIGVYDGTSWWTVQGSARSAFEAVEQKLVEELNKVSKEKYHSSVHYGLFIIGTKPESATPTIVFFCEDEGPRVEMMNKFNNEGLLDRLPGFCTSNRKQQPKIRRLVQPSTGQIRSELEVSAHQEVYYDPLQVQAIGMPIFVKHNDQTFRIATAYRVWKADQCLLMSVSHVFKQSSPALEQSHQPSEDPCGARHERNEEHETNYTGTLSESDSNQVDHPRSPSATTIDHDTDDAPNRGYTTQEAYENQLQPLGTLLQTSANEDWALITIDCDEAKSLLVADRSIPAGTFVSSIPKGPSPIICHAAGAKISRGMLSGIATYMRFPGSSTFEAVYEATLRERIDWGDCGAVVVDVETRAVYGHVVASSEDMFHVFIMPSVSVLASSSTVWQSSSLTETSKPVSEDVIMHNPMTVVPQVSRARGVPFIFRIDEIAEHPDVPSHTDSLGNWIPSTVAGANITVTADPSVSGRWWLCDGQRIREVNQRPSESQLYKTSSVYYVEGVGFRVLRGDARHSPKDDVWHPLQFDFYDNTTYSSYLTDVGSEGTIRLQPQDRRWADLILPDVYHSNTFASSHEYGGLVGELPIFLALIAFSTSREHLPSVLPHMLLEGRWLRNHGYQLPRTHGRGVVVKVYTFSNEQSSDSLSRGSTAKDLQDYEMGFYGKYYY